MIYQSTITKKGQITIPKSLRDVLGLKPASKVSFELEKNKKGIKIKKEQDILDLAGKFKPKGKVVNALKVREMMSKHYGRR